MPAQVEAVLRTTNARRIAIDGADGSGKSTLAEELAATLGIPALHLDDFLTAHQGEYVAHLNLQALQGALSGSAYLLEGICILQVLAQVKAQPDALVYVKRVSHGRWVDAEDLDPSLPIEQHLANLRKESLPLAKAMGLSAELGLAEEVIRYHAEYHPHRKATVVYLRTDG